MIYDKYFTTKDLKDKANDILRYDKYHKIENNDEFDENNKYDVIKRTDEDYDDLKVDTDFSLDSLEFNRDSLDEAFNNTTQTDESELEEKLKIYKQDRDEFNENHGHIVDQFTNPDNDVTFKKIFYKPLKDIGKKLSLKTNYNIDTTNIFNN